MAVTTLGRAGPRGAAVLRAVVAALGVAAVLALVADLVGLALTRIEPPAPPAGAARPGVEAREGRAYAGRSWMGRERGLWELHLEGAPRDLGYAHARLGNRLMMAADDELFAALDRAAPSGPARWLPRLGLRWRYRHLAADIPAARLQEVAGLADGYLDAHADFLPTYHRLLFYQALPELSDGLSRPPLCASTAFTVSGTATSNGHLLVGRNLDLEGPAALDRDKVVLFVRPDEPGRIPFASVAWIGQTAVLTGLNVQGIYASVSAARTDDKAAAGVPVGLLLREVLENATTLEDAVRRVREAHVLIPALFLLGDGKTGESAVVERSPSRSEVRRSRDVLLLANHATTSAFAADAENDRLRRYLTSGARHARLAELVRAHRGVFDPRRVLEVLRDKGGPGGAPLSLGNRNAIDALLATHSVVVDATALVLWVSEGPHLIGRYVGFDLRRELLGEDRPSPPDLPADPLEGTAELRRFQLAADELRAAEALLAVAPDRALEAAERAAGLAATMPEPHRLIADLVRATDHERARREYQRFLDLRPPYLHDIEEVKGRLAGL